MSAERPGGERLVTLHDALAAVGRDLGMPEPDDLALVVACWPELVGEPLAGHSRVRSVRDGECVVEADGPAWASRLRYCAADIVASIGERLGRAAVTQVRVVVARS